MYLNFPISVKNSKGIILFFATLISLLLATFSIFYLTKKEKDLSRIREANIALLDETIVYSNYSTVDWNKIDTLYYRPYNCDWENTIKNLTLPRDFPNSEACRGWHLLQNAKQDFHIKATRARINSTPEIKRALLAIEASFDSVFVHFISDDYYARAFIDKYNPTMSNAFSNLELKIQTEVK